MTFQCLLLTSPSIFSPPPPRLQDDKFMSAYISIYLFARDNVTSPLDKSHIPTRMHACKHKNIVSNGEPAPPKHSQCVCFGGGEHSVCCIKQKNCSFFVYVMRDISVWLIFDFPMCAEHSSVTKLDSAGVSFFLELSWKAWLLRQLEVANS